MSSLLTMKEMHQWKGLTRTLRQNQENQLICRFLQHRLTRPRNNGLQQRLPRRKPTELQWTLMPTVQ